MKKTLLPSALLFSIAANAQITITSADMPNVDDTIRMSIINGTDTYDLSHTGTNYFWDFSYLQPQSQKVDTFVNTLSTDPIYYFYFNNCIPFVPGYDPDHCASYAVPIQPPPSFNSNFQVSDVYYYFKETSSQYTQVGFGAKLNGIPISQKYDPVDIIYEFPLNYGDTFSSTTSFGYDFPNTDDYYGRTTNRKNTVDGWGTLLTPFGTFQTLRVESELNITDTVYSDSLNFGFTIPRPTQYEYKWLANGEKIPVLQINAQEIFGNKSISELIYRDSVRLDIDNAVENIFSENSDVIIYPNPNDGVFNLKINQFENLKIEIINIMGEKVYFQKLTTNNEQRTTINYQLSTNLASGIYLLKIISEKGTVIKKFVKN